MLFRRGGDPVLRDTDGFLVRQLTELGIVSDSVIGSAGSHHLCRPLLPRARLAAGGPICNELVRRSDLGLKEAANSGAADSRRDQG